jgi:hypothetical protein
MYLRGIGWKNVDWMHLAHDRDQWQAVVNTVIPWVSVKGGEFFDWLSDYQLLNKNSAPWSLLYFYLLLYTDVILVEYRLKVSEN